jgi:hypothetical protein
LQKKEAFWRVGLFLFVLMLVAGGFYFYRLQTTVEPGELIRETVKRAHQARAYRYQVAAEYNVEGKRQIWSQVLGEKAAENFHIKGTILGTPVEIFQIGRSTYTRDPVSEKWVILEGNDLTQQQVFWAEINPLSNFQFKTIGNPKLLGTEKVGKRKCWVVEFRPEVESKYLEMWWKSFTYRFWVEKRSRMLLKARATAENKNSPGTFLSLTVQLQDFNKKIEIRPPE